MGKSCVEAEALEERRRQAKMRAAQKRMQGKPRSSGKATWSAVCPSALIKSRTKYDGLLRVQCSIDGSMVWQMPRSRFRTKGPSDVLYQKASSPRTILLHCGFCPSGKHGGNAGKRSPSTGPRSPPHLRGSPDGAVKLSGGSPSSTLGSTPPSTPGSSNGSKWTPLSSRRGSVASIKTAQSSEGCGDSTPLSATGIPRVRGIMYQQRRRDDAGPSPSSGSRFSVSRDRPKSPTSHGRPKSPTSRGRSSRIPVSRGRLSKSPTNRRRESKSLTSRPAADDINPPPRIPHMRGKEG